MNNWKAISGSAAIITLMGSTATFADVTSQEVWQDWHDYMSGFGYEVTASPAVTGDSVTVDNLMIAMPLPDDGGMVKVDFGKISFTDQGDGTVAVILPDQKPIAISVNNDFSVTMNYDTTGMSMVVSGSAQDMTYTYSAPKIAISIADLVVDGEKMDDAKLDLALTNMAGTSNSKMGALRNIVQSFSSDMLTYDVAITEPGGSSVFAVKGSMADFKMNSDTSIPANVDFEKMPEAMANGFAANGDLVWGAGGYEFNSDDHGTTVNGSSSSDSGSLKFALSRDMINYGGTAIGTKASFTSSDFPFPVDITIAESVFNLLMPAGPSDEPKDMNLTLKLVDFNVNDMIWSMADPMGKLPHDAATIVMDVDGKANWLIDIMDPENEANDSFDTPGELHAINLNALQVKIAGADLTGNGAFTFNNDDLETFNGLPAPTGAIDLKLVGGNGLLDNLIAMGMVPEDQAMGVRMMMGLFAVAGDGEDTLTSKIEVNADGSVLANGQRLK